LREAALNFPHEAVHNSAPGPRDAAVST
jgi:hypothetical protein